MGEKPTMDLGESSMKTSKPTIEETRFVNIDYVKPHENVDPYRLACLRTQIETDGLLKLAIAVDVYTKVILDGHHRLEVLRQIGCKRVPVTFVDYSSPFIEVTQWNGLPLSKSEIVKAGMSGRLYPPKTSRHMIRFSSTKKHISAVEERVNVPLSLLKHVVYTDRITTFQFQRHSRENHKKLKPA